MKGKKILSLALAALMMISLFAGCGSTAASTPAQPRQEAAPAEPTPEAPNSAAAEAEPEKEPVTLKVGLLGNSVKPVGVIVADALGFYAEEGVNVEFEKVSSMNDAYMAVSTGDLDVYLFSSTAAATFISQGTTTLRVFGGTAGEGSEIMAPLGTPAITGVEDLLGKTIACQMPETGQMVLKNSLMDQGYTIGGPDDNADVTFIYVQDGNTAVTGCSKGEYDYCITNQCLGYYAEKFGVALVGSVKQFVETYPCCRQTCNETTYLENFDALVAFETATLRGYEVYKTDPDKTLEILVNYAGEDADFIKAQVYGTEDYTPVMRLSLDPDKNACIKFYEGMQKLGEMVDTVEVDWSQYVVSDVYGTALQNLMDRDGGNALWQELMDYFVAHN